MITEPSFVLISGLFQREIRQEFLAGIFGGNETFWVCPSITAE
jgi:hypothetical protein